MKNFKLDEHPKVTPGFKIPEGYFEGFQQEMEQRLASERKVVPIFGKWESWILTAAAILVLALTIPVLNRLTVEKDQPAEAAIENYITYADISDEDIVGLLDKEDIEKIKIDYQLDDNAIEETLETGSNLENYITD